MVVDLLILVALRVLVAVTPNILGDILLDRLRLLLLLLIEILLLILFVIVVARIALDLRLLQDSVLRHLLLCEVLRLRVAHATLRADSMLRLGRA